MDDLAVSYGEAGRRAEALTLQEQALALRRKALGPEHSDTLWAALCLAKSYDESGRHSEAVALLDQTCEAAANDTEALLTLAAWQAWLGQDAYYETTCRRLFLQAEQTDQALTAERAARAACLRPSTNAALLAKALDLAKRAVELGKSDASLPWCQLALGVVEYRTGQYADAERTLAAAEQNGGQSHDIPGTARLFEVLSLFRQNRPEDARKLFSRAKAEIPPPPPDDGQPLANGKPIAHDVLICWLAYKETVSLLGEPVAAKP
jgi:tetratricopeptide (TPR) repeat protein